MCFKRWFCNPDEPVVYGEKTALLFGINDYPGTGNDLSGCINDINDIEDKIKSLWPEFVIRKFKDSEVTRKRFRDELAAAVAALPVGATVAIFTDSCFSAGNTRSNPARPRFFNPGTRRARKFKRKMFRSGTMKWLAFSGCGEKQTSADAFINGRYNGAYTYFAKKCMQKGITYLQLMDLVEGYLPSQQFTQAPELHGPDELQNRLLFEGPTLVVWYSGHGSYLPDNNGDEVDNVDETLYVFDGHLRDDDINEILQTIK